MNKKLLVLIILICILGTGIVFLYREKIGGVGRTAVVQETQPETEAVKVPLVKGIVYVSYAGTYLSLDKDSIVCANTSARPEGIPEMEGIRFSHLIYGKEAEPEDENAFQYVMRVASDLQKNEIGASRICYQDRKITVDIDNLEIKLGKNDKTDDKINDLNNFIDMVRGLRGTLYMQNGDENNYGYTFRASN